MLDALVVLRSIKPPVNRDRWLFCSSISQLLPVQADGYRSSTLQTPHLHVFNCKFYGHPVGCLGILLHNERQKFVADVIASGCDLKGIELLMVTIDLQKWLLVSAAGGSLLLGACAAPTSLSQSQASKTLYAGFGIGGSFLKANTTDLNLNQDNSTSTAGQLVLGVNINSSLAFEGRIADLGEIVFTGGNVLGYQVADISGLYKFDNRKFNAFARAGVGALSSSGDFQTRLDRPAHWVVGAGIGYRLTPRVSMRAEWIGHDIDVSHAQASFIFHFDKRTNPRQQITATSNASPDATKLSENAPAQNPVNIAPQAKLSVPTIVPVPASPASKVSEAPASAPLATNPKPMATPNKDKPAVSNSVIKPATKPVAKSVTKLAETPQDLAETKNLQNNADSAVVVVSDIQKPEKLDDQQLAMADSTQKSHSPEPDLDQDGIIDASDNCPDSENGLAVAADGCSLFSRAVPGLTFWPNTDRLQRSAMTVLDSVVSVLQDQPDLQLTVAAYTAQPEDAEAALFLTRRRIIAITRYLSDQGIDATRLRPEVLSNADALLSATNSAETAAGIDVDTEQVILTPR